MCLEKWAEESPVECGLLAERGGCASSWEPDRPQTRGTRAMLASALQHRSCCYISSWVLGVCLGSTVGHESVCSVHAASQDSMSHLFPSPCFSLRAAASFRPSRHIVWKPPPHPCLPPGSFVGVRQPPKFLSPPPQIPVQHACHVNRALSLLWSSLD